MMNLTKIFAVIIFILISSQAWSATNKPQWVEEKNNPQLWTMARGILKEELAPDDQNKLGPHEAACLYKYISRIMRTNDFALVIIGEAMDKSFPRYLDYFKAFTIDLKTKRKSAVGKKGFSLWKFVKWAYFDNSLIPDTVFRYESCVECEASSLLGSFQFDFQSNRWKIREWPDVGTDILIDNTEILIEDYEGDNYHTKCLYSVKDFTNDGRDDIVTYCRRSGDKNENQAAIATLYTVTSTGPQKRILGSDEARALKKNLCNKNLKKELCK